MARYNEILVGRLNRGIQKWTGIKGEPPAPQLASEIVTGFNLFRGIEERYLDGYDIFGNAAIVNVVGQTSAHRLRNPKGSGIVATITSLVLSVGASEQVQVSALVANTDENVLGAGINLDNRGRPKSSCIYSTNSAAPASTTGSQAFWISNTLAPGSPQQVIIFDDQEIPLLPGSVVLVNAATAATALGVGMVWRERVIEDSEVT